MKRYDCSHWFYICKQTGCFHTTSVQVPYYFPSPDLYLASQIQARTQLNLTHKLFPQVPPTFVECCGNMGPLR